MKFKKKLKKTHKALTDHVLFTFHKTIYSCNIWHKKLKIIKLPTVICTKWHVQANVYTNIADLYTTMYQTTNIMATISAKSKVQTFID